MKRTKKPVLSATGEKELERYGRYLRGEQDLASDKVCNYLSDLRGFAAFCESSWSEGEELGGSFSPSAVTPPAITIYCFHFKNVSTLEALQEWAEVLVRPSKPLERAGRSL